MTLVPTTGQADIDENVSESVEIGICFVYGESIREVLHEVFNDKTLPLDAWTKWLVDIPRYVRCDDLAHSLTRRTDRDRFCSPAEIHSILS